MSDLEIDVVLDILSNKYRREILRLLTSKERYAFELSKILNISQRAITKHLKFLEKANLVLTEKRKSSKGPEREYFFLDQAVVLSFTLAPNLFRASVNALSPDKSKLTPITPALQLGEPKNDKFDDIIKEGIRLFPEIREALDLLQIEQNRYLRAYQGLQAHNSEYLSNYGINDKEIEFVLWLMENEGEATSQELEISIGDLTSLSKEIQNLENKNIISKKIVSDETETVIFQFNLVINSK